MENFKKELFLKEHGTAILYRQATGDQKLLIHECFQKKLGSDFAPNDFFIALKSCLKKCKQFESLESGEDLNNALQSLNLSFSGEVILIWRYPNDMDVFNVSYLIDIWDYVWFSVADDAVAFFFPTLEKLLLITHFNAIYY